MSNVQVLVRIQARSNTRSMVFIFATDSPLTFQRMPSVGTYLLSVASVFLFLHGAQAFASLSRVGRKFQRHDSSLCRASRSIAAFDKTDFALPTGEWPYTDSDMGRVDPSDDVKFYEAPRFVTHIDDRAIQSLTDFYREEFTAMEHKKKGKLDILDLCSSWISHLPDDIALGRVEGVGMNEKELAANKQLTDYHVQDLNKEPVRVVLFTQSRHVYACPCSDNFAHSFLLMILSAFVYVCRRIL